MEFLHLAEEGEKDFQQAATLDALEEARLRYLGKKGRLTLAFQQLGKLPPEERKNLGATLNEARRRLEAAWRIKQGELEAASEDAQMLGWDWTLPGRSPAIGTLHPLTRVEAEICGIFREMGFQTAEGPEVETEENNFLALNFPEDHPARDAQDTFYLPGGFLLRTHTSPVQIRTMRGKTPPFCFIAPGRVYRHEAIDATHHHIFHQVEGFWVDEEVSFAHLKGTLDVFVKRFFGPEVSTRFRPSFFPFTEPSAEMDISCLFCSGRGCRICKQTGWVEMMGCGMIHPNVLQNCRIDPERWRGFAFGMGVERIAMFRYRIDDIRLFYQNDQRFLMQFQGEG